MGMRKQNADLIVFCLINIGSRLMSRSQLPGREEADLAFWCLGLVTHGSCMLDKLKMRGEMPQDLPQRPVFGQEGHWGRDCAFQFGSTVEPHDRSPFCASISKVNVEVGWGLSCPF